MAEPQKPIIPKQKILKGKRRLACVGIQYTNKAGVGEPGAQKCADMVAKFYERNSRGKLDIEAKGFPPLDIGMNASSKAYDRGVEAVRQKHPGFDLYIIPAGGKYTHPHAGRKVAHVQGVGPTAIHELGHLLGLGHAGAYRGGHLDAYADNDSPMSRWVVADYLTAPQYYYLGWLEPDEYVVFDEATPHYNLRRVSDFGARGLVTVMVPPKVPGGRWAFVSSTKGGNIANIALHLSIGGGTQKVAEFKDEYFDERFTGLRIKVLGHGAGQTRVTIDPAASEEVAMRVAAEASCWIDEPEDEVVAEAPVPA